MAVRSVALLLCPTVMLLAVDECLTQTQVYCNDSRIKLYKDEMGYKVQLCFEDQCLPHCYPGKTTWIKRKDACKVLPNANG